MRFRNPFVFSSKEELVQEIAQQVPQAPSKPFFHVVASAPPKLPSKSNLLFEYGDGMFQMPHARLLDGAKFLKPAFSTVNFSLWNKMQGRGTFPIALRARFMPSAPVFGQLFRVTDDDLEGVDNHRLNGVVFKRKLVPMKVPYDRQFTVSDGRRTRTFIEKAYKETEAWMYVGMTSHWKNPLDWDTSFYKGTGGLDFQLASRFKDWNMNKIFYKFGPEDTKHGQPVPDLRFYRTRSALAQQTIHEIDIEEEDAWKKAIEEHKEVERDNKQVSRAQQIADLFRKEPPPF